MKILIAGGAGYVGTVLTPKLIDRGYEVDVVDLMWFGNQLPPSVNVIPKDILDVSEADLRGYDVVIFLGGLSNDPMADYSPAKNFVYNAAAPAYLALQSKRAGVRRFVYAGSCSVYGYTVNELYDETAPAVSQYPYGISKLQGEFGVLQQVDENFSVIALRKGTICGYSPRMRFDLVVNTMFRTGVTTGQITVNNPAIWRPILAIQDAASAYVRAVEAAAPISGVFNVASGNFTLGELADYVRDGLREFMGIETRVLTKHVHDLRNYKVTFEKAQKVLSFHPQYDIRGIIRGSAENCRDIDFDDPRFYNIATFKAIDEMAVAGSAS